MKLFNKKGDEGTTSLLYGKRVPKSDPRPEAYGTLDEATSTLGFARALSQNQRVKEIIVRLQEDILVIGAELATDPQHHGDLKKRVKETDVQELERLIEEFEDQVELPRSFIIPGGTPTSASLDMARTIIRRGERRVVRLKEENLLTNNNILAFLNRTADLLFMLARFEETSGGKSL